VAVWYAKLTALNLTTATSSGLGLLSNAEDVKKSVLKGSEDLYQSLKVGFKMKVTMVVTNFDHKFHELL
jgi:hypothetical protein